jgi:hypothetical protein
MIGSTIIANPFQETRMLQVRRQPATNHGCRCGQAIQQGLQQYDLNDDLNDDLNFMAAYSALHEVVLWASVYAGLAFQSLSPRLSSHPTNCCERYTRFGFYVSNSLLHQCKISGAESLYLAHAFIIHSVYYS